MWPFKKKAVKEEPQAIGRIVIKPETKELGKTMIKFSFKDGRTFNSLCYGTFSQDFSFGIDGTCYKQKAYVKEGFIISSIAVAQNIIRNYQGGCISTFIDDEKNPRCSVMGELVSAQIGKTYPYQEECNVAYLEELK